jgi:hypothetical protein
MRADHRHELKTNELADWLMHFPQWAQENRGTLIVAGVIVVLALGIYVARLYRGGSAATRNQAQLTKLINDLAREESVAAQTPEKFLGFGPTANELKEFADRVGNNPMAAFALIKRGEALRAELHYGTTQITPDEVAKQIDQAKQSYAEALQKAGSAHGLAATAQLGLALCEEESGHLDKAKEMYHEIAKNPAYEGTAARAAAVNRAKTMADYKSTVTFQPAPPPQPVAASAPKVEIGPGDTNAPMVIPTPNSATVKPVAPEATPESNSVSPPAKPAQPAEANRTEANQPVLLQ